MPDRSKWVSPVMLLKAAGGGPVNPLPDRSRWVSPVMLLRAAGGGPDRPAPPRSSTCIPVGIPVGQADSELPPARSSVNPVRAVTSNAPRDSSLPDRSNTSRPADSAEAGTVPVRRLPPRSRRVSSVRPPIRAGTVPAIRFGAGSALGSTG